jgi:NADH-quinone oxidoreductase subunit N
MTPLTMTDLQALSPLVVLGGLVVVLLLAISAVRQHALTAALTVGGLLAALLAIGPALDVAPMQVTDLFTVDRFGLFFAALFVAAAAFTALLSCRYLEARGSDPHEYYVLLAAATAGAVATVFASHFASFLLGIETMSVALYALIAYPDEGRPPLEAAAKYLVLSGVASTTMIFGMALIYAVTGTLAFSTDISGAVGADALYAQAGQAMLWSGIAFKLSLVPFHMWTPDVYEGAPSPIAGFLATVSKGAMFALALRYLMQTGALADPGLVTVLTLLGALSMVIGNLLALMQENVKRILGYSSIAHVGYLLIALLVLERVSPQLAAETTMFYFVAYFIMTVAAFGIVAVHAAADAPAAARHQVATFQGLFWRNPLLAAVFVTVLLSLAGIPMTVGFVAKFYLFAAGVQGDLWLLVWALIVGSGIGVFYYLRIVYAMTRLPEHGDAHGHGHVAAGHGAAPAPLPVVAVPAVALATLAVLGVAAIALGVYPTPLIDVIRTAIDGLGEAGAIAQAVTPH